MHILIRTVFLILICQVILPEDAAAQSRRQRLCYHTEKEIIRTKRRCRRKWTELQVSNMASVLGIRDGEDGQDATALFAKVNSDFTLTRGSGVTGVASTTTPITSSYTVTFSQDISQCVYIATLDNEEDPGGKLSYRIFAKLSGSDPNSVLVSIIDEDASWAQSDFYLAIFC